MDTITVRCIIICWCTGLVYGAGPSDSPLCDVDTPCLTNQTQGGTVLLQPSHKYHIHCDTLTININHSLTIDTANPDDVTPPAIGCDDTIPNPKLSVSSITIHGNGGNCTVTLRNLRLYRTHVNIYNSHVVLENITWYTGKLFVNAKNSTVSVKLLHNTWQGYTYCEHDKCTPSAELAIGGKIKQLYVYNNKFIQTKVTAHLMIDCDVTYESNQLTNSRSELPLQNIVFITLLSNMSVVRVHHSLFQHQYNWNPVDSVMNIFEASLLIRYSNGATDSNNITVYIENCTFYDNERGITFQGPIENISIRNCTFRANIAMHAGAGILLLTQKKALIENSRFEHNAAGRYRRENVRPPGDYFKVEGDEAYVYSNCCKGSISLIGKGGAIRIQKGSVTLVNCQFVNNTATILGGSIFVDRNFTLTIRDTDFMNADRISAAAQQGDIIYSNGKVEINGARFNVTSAANHISLLQHSGDHWSIGVYKISIQCPIGYRLRIMNTSAYQVVPRVGLMRSYMLDQLAYFCESCPRYKYSLERGYFFYEMDPSLQGYYTLMINGDNPNSEFKGTFIYEDIVCKKCPYGGNCDNDQLKSLPNFWGYTYNEEVKFQLCPKGYCCSQKSCPSYNSCAKYRTGKLCSKCIEGYSEALFSPKCIPNKQCGPVWIWFLPVAMGLLYTLLLFFQKDVRDYIFTVPALKCTAIPKVKANKHKEKSEIKQDGNNSPLLHKENKMIEMTERGFSYKSESNEENGRFLVNGQIQEQPTEIADNKASISDQSESRASKEEPKSANDFGAIMLITILYYFQDAQLLHVKTAFATEENPRWSLVKAVLLGLFKFQIDIAQFLNSVCLMEGLSASVLMLAKTLLVPYVLILYGLLYIGHYLLFQVRYVKRPHSVGESDQCTFECRLAMGFMLALLFTYQMLATTAFTLLNCVPVGNDSVLFIDATVACYTEWQYGVLIYSMTCIVLFSIVLMLGPGLLKDGRISLATFFAACIFPFPFVIAWFFLRICKRDNLMKKNAEFPTAPGKVVIQVLQGPFKDIQSKVTGPVCWAGVLIFRRLLLVLLYTFINISLLRIITMLLTCFIVLLNQVHVKPYRDPRANVAQSASIAALMFVGGINLVRAGFEAAEYTPHGPYMLLVVVMQETENTLMLWIPLAFMILMGLILITKITFNISAYITKKLK